MTRKQLVAEIATQMKQYDEYGLIDYISINNWIRNALREFGGNIMSNLEEVLEVKDGKAKLPENFYSLYMAVKCDMSHYELNDKKDKKYLQTSIFYTERLEKSLYWDNTFEEPCLKGVDCSYIKEDTYFVDSTNNKRPINLYYTNPTLLKLKKGHMRPKCDKDSPNLGDFYSDYEITIENNYLFTNFNKGNIYIQYRGLPTDEEGDLIIPEIQRNKLVEYIQYTCIRRTLQNLLLNSDDPNIGQKFQLYKQLENEAYAAAKNDTINEGMLGWREEAKKNNRARRRKFEVMYRPL